MTQRNLTQAELDAARERFGSWCKAGETAQQTLNQRTRKMRLTLTSPHQADWRKLKAKAGLRILNPHGQPIALVKTLTARKEPGAMDLVFIVGPQTVFSETESVNAELAFSEVNPCLIEGIMFSPLT